MKSPTFGKSYSSRNILPRVWWTALFWLILMLWPRGFRQCQAPSWLSFNNWKLNTFPSKKNMNWAMLNHVTQNLEFSCETRNEDPDLLMSFNTTYIFLLKIASTFSKIGIYRISDTYFCIGTPKLEWKIVWFWVF